MRCLGLGLWSGLAVNDLSSAIAVGQQMGGSGGVMAAASKSARVLCLAPVLFLLATRGSLGGATDYGTAMDKLTAALELHMEIEERDVYPLVEEYVGDEEAEEATVEHGLARTGLRQLKELVDEPGFGAVVSMLTAGIKHHVKEEEQEVLPELKRKLDRGELSELGDRIAAAKKPSRSRARVTASR